MTQLVFVLRRKCLGADIQAKLLCKNVPVTRNLRTRRIRDVSCGCSSSEFMSYRRSWLSHLAQCGDLVRWTQWCPCKRIVEELQVV